MKTQISLQGLSVTKCETMYLVAFILLCGLGLGEASVAIDFHPQSQEVILYQQAAFGVIAKGTPPLSFQWSKDGIPIQGATNDQLVLPQAKFSDEGIYSVEVQDIDSKVVSTAAELFVDLPRAGDVDGSFVVGGMIDGTLRAVVAQADGKVLIGGDFTTVHGALRGGIARLNMDGTTDHTFMNGLAGADAWPEWSYHRVEAIALQGDSKILIGGRFNKINGESKTNIARLNMDGSLDSSFEASVSGTIYALAPQDDGKVLVGGQFNQVNGIARTNIARLNPDGSLDIGFNASTEQYQYLLCVAIQSDGKVLIGGFHILRRLHEDGAVDSEFQNISLNGSPKVSSIAIQPDGKILFGGGFTTVNGQGRNSFARLHADGTLDNEFNPALPVVSNANSTFIHSILLQADGRMLVAGGSSYTGFSGATIRNNFVSRFGIDGTRDSNFSNYATDMVYALAWHSAEKVLAVGSFHAMGDQTTVRIARLNANGQVDASFNNGVAGADSWIRSMALQNDGNLLVAGNFKLISGSPRNGVARIRPDGLLDSFAPDIWGRDSQVKLVSVQNDGRVLVAGQDMLVTPDRFERVYVYKSLLRLSPNGGFQESIVHKPAVVSAISTDSTLLYGGSIGVGGWTGLPTNSIISVIASQTDEKILVAGSLGHLGALARLHSQSELDESFQPMISGGIQSILVQPDQKILIAGSFTIGSEVIQRKFARLLSDGSLDPEFNSNISPFVQSIHALAIQPNGKLILGGGFRFNEQDARTIVRLNADGTLDPHFKISSRLYPEEAVLAANVQPDGKIVIGGYFRAVNGHPAAYIARLWGEDFPPVLKGISHNGNQVNLSWRTTSNRTYRVQYKDDIAAPNWLDLLGDIEATARTASKTDNTITSGQRFYRVIEVQ